jgi:hypothetical protein
MPHLSHITLPKRRWKSSTGLVPLLFIKWSMRPFTSFSASSNSGVSVDGPGADVIGQLIADGVGITK